MTQCVYPGCSNPAYAQGYCKTHYSLYWKAQRHKKNLEQQEAYPGLNMSQIETLQARQRELERANLNYSLVCSLDAMLNWRRIIEDIEKEIAEMLKNVAPSEIPPGEDEERL